MTKWRCNNTKQGTNQGTKCTQHQITVSNIHVFIPWPSKGHLSWMEALPHVTDSQRWLTDTGLLLLLLDLLVFVIENIIPEMSKKKGIFVKHFSSIPFSKLSILQHKIRAGANPKTIRKKTDTTIYNLLFVICYSKFI